MVEVWIRDVGGRPGRERRRAIREVMGRRLLGVVEDVIPSSPEPITL